MAKASSGNLVSEFLFFFWGGGMVGMCFCFFVFFRGEGDVNRFLLGRVVFLFLFSRLLRKKVRRNDVFFQWRWILKLGDGFKMRVHDAWTI